MILIKYTPEVEQRMRLHYEQLGEKDRRHYASIEADKLGYGGRRYISQLLGLHQRSIRKGIEELKSPALLAQIPQGKHRRAGGGRKKRSECPRDDIGT